jgi:NADH dehydrogenase
MTILVTGAAGFLGRHTVHCLVEEGKPVRAMVHHYGKAEARLGDLFGQLETVQAEVTDREAVRRAMQGVDTLIHLVAIPIEKGKATYEGINYQGTVCVMEEAMAAGVDRLIYLSQNGAHSKHFSPFLRSKGKADEVVQESPLQWTILHPSLAFGSGDKVFNSLARLIRLTPWVFPEINGGGTPFQPISVHDIVEVIRQCLDDDETIGKHYSLGGPEVLTLGEITRRVLHVLGEERRLIPVPIPLLEPPTLLMHHLLPHPPVSVTLLRLLAIPNMVLHNNDCGRFGIQPRPFAGENLAYLERTSAFEAIRNFLGIMPD